MELSQKQNLIQTMRQEQVMTHQQIQALELLFLPVLELDAAINAEIEKNPVLEVDKVPDDAPEPDPAEGDEWLDKVLKLDDENRYIRSGAGTGSYSKENEEKRQYYLDSITDEPSFQETLLQQLKFLDLTPKQRDCCEAVISGLDDDGYLISHPADLAMASGQSMAAVNEAIHTVQQLDPPGVAAPDLRTRLLLQLERQGRRKEPVYTAVSKYLNDIAANHLPQVAKKMHLSLDELKEIIGEIQKLNPRLSSDTVSPHEYIREEVTVEKENGELTVRMNNEHLPNLYISKKYRELLDDPNTPKETRDYIKEKLQAGVFLINSIIQRQLTIRKIATALVEFQRDFFLHGREHLKPLTMAQIAAKVGIHETTVSRAVAGKYLRCDYGLIPLRSFFTSGYETEDGQAVSKNVVMDAIRQMIEEEDPFAPLSDSAIVKELKEKGYNVARRTVAKYRDGMNILPSNLRRKY
ncbi:MAG: RNA polymerase factor sigma-54 [Victivallales bacterium]|nr:RNA polymerase factor sigma-54 [Victivallales bacterium]